MIGGIFIALYSVPDSTRLSVFLLASGLCFVAGNIFLFRMVKRTKGGKSKEGEKAWPHIFRALAVVAVAWLLILLMSKK